MNISNPTLTQQGGLQLPQSEDDTDIGRVPRGVSLPPSMAKRGSHETGDTQEERLRPNNTTCIYKEHLRC